jgi:hypothetical protein
MTRRGHAGDMGDYDLPDENLTDCLLQAEVVRACLCQQRAPWRCQDHTMDPVGSVAGRWTLEAKGGVERSRIKHEAGVVGITSISILVWPLYTQVEIPPTIGISPFYNVSSIFSTPHLLAFLPQSISSFVSSECASTVLLRKRRHNRLYSNSRCLPRKAGEICT